MRCASTRAAPARMPNCRAILRRAFPRRLAGAPLSAGKPAFRFYYTVFCRRVKCAPQSKNASLEIFLWEPINYSENK